MTRRSAYWLRSDASSTTSSTPTSSRYATLTDDDMKVMGGWSGIPVTIGFRQWRWSSHIHEHTIQIEKTLDMLGMHRSEVDWLTRLNARAFGRLGPNRFWPRVSRRRCAAPRVPCARPRRSLPQLVAAAQANIPAEDW